MTNYKRHDALTCSRKNLLKYNSSRVEVFTVNVKRQFEFCSLFVTVICFCFILLSRNDGGALYWTKPHLLWSFSALKKSIRKKQRLNYLIWFFWLVYLYPPITKKRQCAMLWTNPHPLSSWPFSGWRFTFSHVNLLLVRSHQAEIIVVKRLIQGRNSVTKVRVKLMIMRSESS